MKILFICTGNTCRSPMAQGIANKLFKNVEFFSAGISVNRNESVSKNAILALAEMGIDISTHKPTQLNAEIARNADYIIPMTQNHMNWLLCTGVEKNKIKLFSQPISDPYGADLDTYKACANQLRENILTTVGALL